MAVAIDTSFLIELLRGSKKAVQLAKRLDRDEQTIVIPAPVEFEVHVGLCGRPSRVERALFETAAARWESVAFDDHAASHAAEIQAELAAQGKRMAIVDVMVAGICRAKGHQLATLDRDFERVRDAFGLPLVMPA